jgi:hypothetical protein
MITYEKITNMTTIFPKVLLSIKLHTLKKKGSNYYFLVASQNRMVFV